jgi:Protein of unknown function (DUF1554)
MSHWRLRSVWWTLGLGVVVVMALVLGAPPPVAAEGDDNPCEGFTGACRGQCDAALDQSCFANPDTRQCGKREEQWEFLACPGTPPWALKRVFVTSTTYTGNLGGLGGADDKCQAQATAAGLGGRFQAWLSADGTGNSAAARLTHATVPYVRVDGVQVAANYSDLVDGTLAQPIAVDESGAPASGLEWVWTGTTHSGGFSGFDCQGWGNGGAAAVGTAGNRTKTDSTWTNFDGFICSQTFRLYCMEQ